MLGWAEQKGLYCDGYQVCGVAGGTLATHFFFLKQNWLFSVGSFKHHLFSTKNWDNWYGAEKYLPYCNRVLPKQYHVKPPMSISTSLCCNVLLLHTLTTGFRVIIVFRIWRQTCDVPKEWPMTLMSPIFWHNSASCCYLPILPCFQFPESVFAKVPWTSTLVFNCIPTLCAREAFQCKSQAPRSFFFMEKCQVLLSLPFWLDIFLFVLLLGELF